MALRTDASIFLSPRRFLIKIHLDLFKIDRLAKDDCYLPLSDFEILVLCLEDKRFFSHHGVDVISFFREFWRAITFRRFGGASTIDMQFSRTATDYRERTIRRKLYEMILAFIIQYRYSKIQILRSYLSCAFFGSRIYGVESAAYQIWKINKDEMSFDQSAELAAMLVYPKPLVPSEKWRTKIGRRASYAKRLYPRLKERLKKLPSPELVNI